MTTRAGAAGLLTGLITTVIVYLFYLLWPEVFLQGWSVSASRIISVTFTLIVTFIIIAGGFLAGRWSGSVQPWRSAVLGGLAGGLAATILFCLWGAAASGSASLILTNPTTGLAFSQGEIISAIIRQTMGMFLVLFLGGIGLGALGGRLACRSEPDQMDEFDMAAPQMAMNVSITAVPASIIAAALAADVFPRMAGVVDSQTSQILYLPLKVALLLVLISQLALNLVVPHETRQAENLSGMDEVKMAAYVGIGAAPLLILLLFLVQPECLAKPLVSIALILCTSMSGISLFNLFKRVLPRRASFQTPLDKGQQNEAKWFGSIAVSHGPRLAKLCTGCGLVMVLPLYVCVVSLLINLTSALSSSTLLQPDSEIVRKLFLLQAMVSMGSVTATILLLVLIYIFYLNLGRWFRKRNANRLE